MVKAALVALGLLVGLGSAGALAKGAPIYTVAKVSVEAEAKDAVEAKQIAINEGQQAALRTLAAYSGFGSASGWWSLTSWRRRSSSTCV